MIVNLNLPTAWNELTQKQLAYVFWLLSANFNIDAIKTYCLFRWCNLDVVSGTAAEFMTQNSRDILVKQGKRTFLISPMVIHSACEALDFLSVFPDSPIQLEYIGKYKALPADFEGVPFRTYIVADNFYQGYLITKDKNLLDELAKVLYDEKVCMTERDRIATLYWFASLKRSLAVEFPHFFRPSNGSVDAKKVKDAMNAQIRALTKGDITKESLVLDMDTSRALTELDALAEEYEDMNNKFK